jgi:hypothetical protein
MLKVLTIAGLVLFAAVAPAAAEPAAFDGISSGRDSEAAGTGENRLIYSGESGGLVTGYE